ncbi:MAG: hypothetical protein Ta2E_02850 [Mycoplasmoidaceae bacterium]|nr:MAG: hypothetical protein Ta2E_02850 [Mycoplasmoidaceae bacterium]
MTMFKCVVALNCGTITDDFIYTCMNVYNFYFNIRELLI